jgi:hypothetical protein
MNITPESLASMSFNQRVAAAADYAIDILKPEALKRSELGRAQQGERRRSSQYNTEDRVHLGNGQRSAAEAGLLFGASKSSVAQAITVRDRDRSMFEAMRAGKCSLYHAYSTVADRHIARVRRDLTPKRINATLDALRMFIVNDVRDLCGRRRVPSERSIRQENHADPMLFNALWHRLLDAHKAGKLDETIDTIREML